MEQFTFTQTEITLTLVGGDLFLEPEPPETLLLAVSDITLKRIYSSYIYNERLYNMLILANIIFCQSVLKPESSSLSLEWFS